MNEATSTSAKAGSTATRFSCQEVWGGNRSISAPIELPGMRGTLVSRSCDGQQGGDIYYLSVCGSDLLSRFCIADVTGHGRAVAAVSSAVHEQMRRSMNRFDQRRILSRLNQTLYDNEFDGFATAISGTYFPPTGRLSISLAGHEPCWWYRSRASRWERLRVADSGRLNNVALGVDPSVRYTRRKVKVETGDRLVIVTDGILEAADASGSLFGVERLERCLEQCSAHSSSSICQHLATQMSEHMGNAKTLQDDTTLLVLEFVDNIHGSALWQMLRNRLGWGRSQRMAIA